MSAVGLLSVLAFFEEIESSVPGVMGAPDGTAQVSLAERLRASIHASISSPDIAIK